MTIKFTSTEWVGAEPENTDIVLRSEAGLTGKFTDFSNEVFLWCFDNGIEADMVGKKYNSDDNSDYSLWRIENEQHRTWFILRWA